MLLVVKPTVTIATLLQFLHVVTVNRVCGICKSHGGCGHICDVPNLALLPFHEM